MKVKNAYYYKTVPSKIVIEALDGTLYWTNVSPFRQVQESELTPVPYVHLNACDEFLIDVFRFYGLEKVKPTHG